MRNETTQESLQKFMKELARRAPRTGKYHVYFVGGGTAVHLGWRLSSVDVDVYSDHDVVFREIQEIKERLNINVEFERPEDCVPPLKGSASRHLFIETIGSITFHHYDPYAQLFSKVTRGFKRDLDDARQFVKSGLVDVSKLRLLVAAIPDSAFAKYPALSRAGVEGALEEFLAALE